MIDYGQKKEYLFEVPNIDYQIDVAFLKINQWTLFPTCLIPLYLEKGVIAIVMAILLYCFCFWASQREDEGRPVTLSPTLIKLLSSVPKSVRAGAFPSIAAIRPFCDRYRR